MIEVMQGMPENVLAVVATGKVTGKDYDDVLIPAVEAKLCHYKKIRMLYQLGPEFDGFTPEAMWNDAKVGLWHIKEFERIALVTDVDWVRAASRLLRFVIPCPMKIYTVLELEQAKAWISS